MNNQAYAIVQKNVPPSDNLEKLTRDVQIGPPKGKTIWEIL